MTRRPLALALTITLALTACGGSGDRATTIAAPKPPAKETRDPLPERPREWRRFANDRGGYALLLPPGWEGKAEGPQSLIRSFDRLVAISIAPDRSAGAMRTPLADYAANTAADLGGFEHGLAVEGARRLDHRYEAYEVYGTGRGRDGIEQRASVIVLRRGRVGAITVVLAANAMPAARGSARLGRRAISTLRTRPPRTGG